MFSNNEGFTYENVLNSAALGVNGCRKVIILRGEPGVGKTTLAEKLKCQKPHAVEICEADQYFVRPDGYYDFNWRLLSQAHDWCFNKFSEYVENWMPVIIVSNTATRLSEFKRYVDLAEKEKYEVIVVRLTRNFGNVHGVLSDKVDLMKKRIEEYLNEIVVI